MAGEHDILKGKRKRETAAPNDVGAWGEKKIRGAYAQPLAIAGEKVDVDELPAFGDEVNKDARAPLAPPGSP